MKKRIVVIALSVAFVITAVIVGTLAYLSDRSTQSSIYSVAGSPDSDIGVDIYLTESNWNPVHAQDLVGGNSVEKNPTMHIVQGPVYGRMKLVLLEYKEDENDPDVVMTDTVRATKLMDMISGWHADFVLDSVRNASEPWVYYYELSYPLYPGEEYTLFEEVNVPSEWGEDALLEVGNFIIRVEAQAVQVANFTDAQEAFQALDGITE